MAGTINKDHLKKLMEVWNEYALRDDDDLFSSPQYKGLSLRFNAREWREDRPQEFPEFFRFKKAHSYVVSRRYECGDWHLPSDIIKMLIDHEVTYDDIEAFITKLLKEKDKKDQRTIFSFPEKTSE